MRGVSKNIARTNDVFVHSRAVQQVERTTLQVTAFVLSICLGGCSQTRTQSAPLRTVGYRFECTPRDATLTVDEVNIGRCLLWEQRYLGLGPGTHRVRVDREGFLSYEQELGNRTGRGTLRVQLRERPE